jgi:serine/threonine-protein kinase
MGVVWAARHTVTNKEVALKMLKPEQAADEHLRERFVREAKAACAVSHPNIVDVHDVLELDDGSAIMVMDLLEGETLGQKLDREGLLGLGEFARILLPVVSAVGTAHAAGVVHRDLKPDNIFLVKEQEGTTTVKVLDFGIAKVLATEDGAQTGNLTGTGAMLGTPYYMSPEQIFGERDIDHRADIWALGVIFYECLSGKRPTQADNIGQILKIISKNAIKPLDVVLPTLPKDLTDLVARMLSPDRDARPQSLMEVKGALARYADVAVRSFADPARASRKSLPSKELSDSSERVLVRSSDDVSPLAKTEQRPPSISQERRAPDPETLSPSSAAAQTTSDTPRKPPSRTGWLMGGAAVVVVASVGIFVGTRNHEQPKVPATPIASPSTPSVAIDTSGPVVTSSVPAVTPSTTQTVPAATSIAGTKPVPAHSTKPQASATTSASAKALPGGVVEKPPF